jgi:hypothetical protein
MTQAATNPFAPEGAHNLIKLLERHRTTLPFADEEIAYYTDLRNSLDAQRQHSEETLSAWRSSLSRRWECEVTGQRVLIHVQRKIVALYGDDAVSMRVIAPGRLASAMTPSDLLNDLRRLEASIALLMPRPPFADETLAQLADAATRLSTAIDDTARCEAERRTALLDQRLALSLYERACGRTRQLLAEVLGPE